MSAAPATAIKSQVDQQSWDAVKRFMLRHCGVVLSDEQSYLLEPRLSPVAKQYCFTTTAELVSAACSSPPTAKLGMALIDAMTTHETMFFRDPAFWKTLEKTVLPELLAGNRGGLRIWSAACSTGQEAYSMAMLLDECFPQHFASATIFANDVSELTVQKARSGIFTTLEVNRGLGAVRLQRHFQQAPGGFQIAERLRSRIAWSTQNLLGVTSGVSDCDLVLCRNVLIYFGELDRATVIKQLYQCARPKGVVGVGSTESIRDAKALAPGLYIKA